MHLLSSSISVIHFAYEDNSPAFYHPPEVKLKFRHVYTLTRLRPFKDTILVEVTLRHLRYTLTDVPPQSNSNSMHVLALDLPQLSTSLTRLSRITRPSFKDTILVEVTLGHLRYTLTGVPPQSNSNLMHALALDLPQLSTSLTRLSRIHFAVREPRPSFKDTILVEVTLRHLRYTLTDVPPQYSNLMHVLALVPQLSTRLRDFQG